MLVDSVKLHALPKTEASVQVSAPIDAIAIDIMGPLPVTVKGNQHKMVVMINSVNGLRPMHTAQIVADKLVTEFICMHFTPSYMHTNQGRKFKSLLNYALYK